MISDISEFCKLYYASTFFPIAYFDSGNQKICSYPKTAEKLDLYSTALPSLQKGQRNPDYFITNSFAYYGIIRIRRSGGFLILGPLFSTVVSDSTQKNFMHECAIAPDEKSLLTQFFSEAPIASFNQFLATLTYVHYCINDEKLNFITHFAISDETPQKNISTMHSSQIYNAKEEQVFHNTYLFEQQYLSYVQNGEVDKLNELLLNAAVSLKEGKVADNALRQSKNIFVAAVTLTTRSAIAGGLDIEQAYQLSDVYINESEKAQSPDTLANLQLIMTLDFAERVSKNKIPQGMSREIFECVQFISRHTNEPIRVDDVAEHIGRSRSYTSKKFKEELGFDLSAFIMRCKLEEAKSLLTYSDKTLSEISNYLCFSSQAYFQNVFKKKYGLTPMQYRNQTIKA